MTGLPTPPPIPGVGSPPPGPLGLYGLHVVLGHQDKAGRWVRQPTADFTCPYGCIHTAAGSLDVARFTEAINDYHRKHCPARTTRKDTA